MPFIVGQRVIHPLRRGLYIARFMPPDMLLGYSDRYDIPLYSSHNFVWLANIWIDFSHQNLAHLPKMKKLYETLDDRLDIQNFATKQRWSMQDLARLSMLPCEAGAMWDCTRWEIDGTLLSLRSVK